MRADLKSKMSIESTEVNLEFSETYDQEDDTYYVTFKTGEPSYCVELDDVLLLEVGMFTKLPTGFRILNFNKNKVKAINCRVLIKEMTHTLKSTQPTFRERKHAVEHALEKVFA